MMLPDVIITWICWAFVWLLATFALLYLFIYGEGWVVPLLSACVIAVLLYVLRKRCSCTPAFGLGDQMSA